MNLEKIMIELKRDYIKNFPNHLNKMKTYFSSKKISSLKSHFHKLKGSGKTYGLPEVSELSQIMEEVFSTHLNDQELEEVSIPCLNLYKEIHKHYSNIQNAKPTQFESKSFNLFQRKEFLTLKELKEFKEKKVQKKAS